MKKYNCLLFFLINVCTLQAQPTLTDSLRQTLRNRPDDTTKVKLLFVATRYFPYNQPDSGLYYSDSIIRLSEKLNYPYGQAIGYRHKSVAYLYSGDYSRAMLFNNKSLRICEALNKRGDLSLTENLAGIYFELGDYQKALEYMLQSRESLFSSGDSIYLEVYGRFREIAYPISMNDKAIAEIFLEMGKIDSALKYGRRAHSFWQNRWSVIHVLMGDIYSAAGDYPAALNYYYTKGDTKETVDSAKNFLGRARLF